MVYFLSSDHLIYVVGTKSDDNLVYLLENAHGYSSILCQGNT